MIDDLKTPLPEQDLDRGSKIFLLDVELNEAEHALRRLTHLEEFGQGLQFFEHQRAARFLAAAELRATQELLVLGLVHQRRTAQMAHTLLSLAKLERLAPVADSELTAARAAGDPVAIRRAEGDVEIIAQRREVVLGRLWTEFAVPECTALEAVAMVNADASSAEQN